MSVLCTARVERILKAARKGAAGLGHQYVGTEHLLFGVLSSGPPELRAALSAFEITADRVRQALPSYTGSKGPQQALPWSPRACEILADALRRTASRGKQQIDAASLVMILFSYSLKAGSPLSHLIAAVSNRSVNELAPIAAVIDEWNSVSQ